MSPAAIALVLTAAIAHASWNLFSKQAAATGAVFFLWLLATSATLIYLPVVLIASAFTSPHLAALNWVFLIGTGVIQAGYFLFLQLGYGLGDLSLVYPVGRGTGALLAATAGIVLLGERPGVIAIIGIAAIIAGVAAISLPSRTSGAQKPSAKAIGFALVTGAFIAAYTIWDKYAVGTLHTPPLLQGYAAFPFMTLAFWPFVARDRTRLAQVARDFRPQILGAGALAPLAYILVLAALSFTAVSAIAPAREVSVLFGVLLGRRLLGEGGLARRLAGAALIVAGIIAIAVG
ncbi:MAG TPA: DMT family transporter [Streptosporangiaceae bacterium]|nr:DMT family transporter [Streptosporangiaceae bacterium]